VVDTTCAPADIAYRVDIQLLYRARLKSEALIKELYAKYPPGSLQSRTYHKISAQMENFHQHPQSFPVKKPGYAHNFANGFQRNMGHIDYLLND
jgi:hypothetical protein|tara:strand:+ start:246 stop:527 length:282 start_codon:yes stop_codon:yes gene_type:complete